MRIHSSSLRAGVLTAQNAAKRAAFTLVEMLVVVAIIGILAALALPHLGGFTKSNSMTAATQQLLDDVSFARQKALVNRTTVYMVFVPPGFWGGPNANVFNNLGARGAIEASNLLSSQFTSYALLSLRSIGDQPGRSYARYLSPWRHLPEGVFVAQDKFTKSMQVTDTNLPVVSPFTSNNVYFPSVDNGANNFSLPTVAFDGQGQLVSRKDEYIPLTRGSVMYYRNGNGLLDFGNADVSETPPGNATNNWNLIHINWLTGRAKLERLEIK